MTNYLYLLFSTLFLFSCNKQPELNGLERIELTQLKHTLWIQVPPQLDTTFTTINHSDNICDASTQTLYTQKNDAKYFESFVLQNDDLPNYMINISQPLFTQNDSPCNSITELTELLEAEKNMLLTLNTSTKISYQEVKLINGKAFAIIESETDKSYTLSATTLLDHSNVSITFWCLSNNQEEFKHKAWNGLESIHITPFKSNH